MSGEVAKADEKVTENTVGPVLDKLFKTNSVTVSDGDVKIKKVSLRTMKPITDLIGKVFKDLKLDPDTALPTVDLQDPSLILKLISENYDEVMDLIPKLSDIEKEKLLDLPLDESVMIAQGVIALNKDFFMKKVLPSLKLFGLDVNG